MKGLLSDFQRQANNSSASHKKTKQKQVETVLLPVEATFYTVFIPKLVPHALTVLSVPLPMKGVKIKACFQTFKLIPGGPSCAFNIALYL